MCMARMPCWKDVCGRRCSTACMTYWCIIWEERSPEGLYPGQQAYTAMPFSRQASARTRVYVVSQSLLTPYMLPGQPCSLYVPDLTPSMYSCPSAATSSAELALSKRALSALLLRMRSFPAMLHVRSEQ